MHVGGETLNAGRENEHPRVVSPQWRPCPAQAPALSRWSRCLTAGQNTADYFSAEPGEQSGRCRFGGAGALPAESRVELADAAGWEHRETQQDNAEPPVSRIWDGFSTRAAAFKDPGSLHSPNLSNDKWPSDEVRIGSIIIFHLSKLWKVKFFILCDVVFLVRLQGKFGIDHSWEWKGKMYPVWKMGRWENFWK